MSSLPVPVLTVATAGASPDVQCSQSEERNRLYALWLSTGRERDRKKHAGEHGRQ